MSCVIMQNYEWYVNSCVSVGVLALFVENYDDDDDDYY